MPEDILQSNMIVLQTLCPVHIGSGERLGRFDFVRVGKKIIRIDENKLMQRIASHPSSEKITSDLVDFAESGRTIQALLDHYSIPIKEVEAYAIEVDIDPRSRIREIYVFIKNPFNQPFLPGSSLKGSLRSSLLRGIFLENGSLRKSADKHTLDQAKQGISASAQVEALAFIIADVDPGKRSNFDVNRVLLIHDSYVKSLSDLEVFEVQVLSYQHDGSLKTKTVGGGQSLSIFVEALKTKTTFQLPATWQINLLNGLGEASQLGYKQIQRFFIYLPEFCRAASLDIMEQEISFYNDHGYKALAGWYETQRDRIKRSSESVFLLPLGWGSGYDAKAVTDLFSEATFKMVVDKFKNTRGLGHPGNKSASTWLGPKLSPKSRKIVIREGKDPEPIGWVAVTFRPSGEPKLDWLNRARQKGTAKKPTDFHRS